MQTTFFFPKAQYRKITGTNLNNSVTSRSSEQNSYRPFSYCILHILLAYIPLLIGKIADLLDQCVFCVYIPAFVFFIQVANFNKIWYDDYATSGQPNLVHFEFI